MGVLPAGRLRLLMTLVTTLRRLIHALKGAPDHFTHGWRRAAALEHLRASPMPRTILVVCHGNLCRSPYAAAAMRRAFDYAKLAVQVESAGFLGPHRQPPEEAVAAAADRGLALDSHRSRLISRQMLDSADLIVVMEPRQAAAVTTRQSGARRVVVLADFDPDPTTRRWIKDPFGRARSAFDECYDRIDRCVAELVRGLPVTR